MDDDATDKRAAPPVRARSPVPHGGDLRIAIERFGGPAERWIDLSTGINPHGYPVPAIDTQAWLRLPDDHDGLAELAASYYGARRALPVAGSQSVIRLLPDLLPRCSDAHAANRADAVGIATLTYGEYAPAFARAGHRVLRYGVADRQSSDFIVYPGSVLPPELLHLVVVNPNNPTAEQFDADTLLGWHAQLTARGGCLIVDEAFADVAPHASVAAHSALAGLIVLRSIGKFFGLAGARAGFTLAEPALLDALAAELGPWTLTGPTRAAVRAALQDQAWQCTTRAHLHEAGERLVALLTRRGLAARGTPLFAWAPHGAAAALQKRLAGAAIWVRLFDDSAARKSAAFDSQSMSNSTNPSNERDSTLPAYPSGLRFGLPGSKSEWDRLDAALADCRDLIDAGS
jgi:cobalamin biosynthetic protein CobC